MNKDNRVAYIARHQMPKVTTRVRAQQQRATEKYNKKKRLIDAPTPHAYDSYLMMTGMDIEAALRSLQKKTSCQVSLFDDAFLRSLRLESLSASQLSLFDETDLSEKETLRTMAEPEPTSMSSVVDVEDVSANVDSFIEPSYVLPPQHAEYLLYFCLPASQRECLPGDLYEEYNQEILPRFGEARANWWYWGQVARSIWPILGHRLVRMFTWGAVARAADALWRRFIA